MSVLRDHWRLALLFAGVLLVLLAASFSAGRLSAPTKVVEKEKTVEVRVVDQEAIAKAVEFARSEWKREVVDHSTIRTVYRDGKPIEKVVYVVRDTSAGGSSSSSSSSSTDVRTHEATERVVEREKLVERAPPSLRLLAGISLAPASDLKLRAELGASKRILGPLSLGAGVSVDPKAFLRDPLHPDLRLHAHLGLDL